MPVGGHYQYDEAQAGSARVYIYDDPAMTYDGIGVPRRNRRYDSVRLGFVLRREDGRNDPVERGTT